MMSQSLLDFGIILIIAGFAAAFIGAILLALGAFRRRGSVKAGGAILIGPIPIVFGSDKESMKAILALSIALTAILLVITILSYLR